MSQSKPDAKFPVDFLWGAATAAQQVEGNLDNDWTAWEASVADKLASTAESRLAKEVPSWEAIHSQASDPANYISGVTDDHYVRYQEDFALMKQLGLNSYRLSVEWARVEPEYGHFDSQAIDHYVAMVSSLRKLGIEPLVTLHHFTNPRWLEEHGGWHGNEVAKSFSRYAETVAKAFGNKVKYYVSINEPGSYLLMRYLGGGAWPEWPKIAMNPSLGYRYLKNVSRAHREARAAIKAVNPEAQVGMAHGLLDYQLGRRDPLSWIMKQLLDYCPDIYLMNRLKKDLDFIGVNYYMRMVVKSGLSSPAAWGQKWNGKDPQNDMGWGIYPEGLYNVTQRVSKYHLPLLITENGIPDASDKQRGKFISDHLEQALRSRDDGADIRGYFYWSLLDNYEWSEGFWPKFGLIEVDRTTQKRTLKPSALSYSELIRGYRKLK